MWSLSPFLPSFSFSTQSSFAAAPDNYRWVERADGLLGTQIVGIAVHPQDANTVYALSAAQGVFKTIDGGDNWENKTSGVSDRKQPWSGYPGNLLTMDRQNPDTLYAAFGGKVYKTIDGAENWFESNTGITGTCSGRNFLAGVIVDPQDSNHLFAGRIIDNCSESALFESTDAGEHWTQISTTGIGNDIWHIAIDPSDAQNMYSMTIHIGFSYSRDGGHTWTRSNPDIPFVDGLGAVAIHPQQTSRVFLGNPSGLFVSDDQGVTWEKIENVTGSIRSIQIAPSDSDRVYAVGTAGLYASMDAGENWVFVEASLDKNTAALGIDAFDADHIFVGMYGEGVYTSTNGGATLEEVNTGISSTSWITQIERDSETGNIFALAAGKGLYKSSDNGLSWSISVADSKAFDFEMVGQTILMGKDSSVLRLSTDGGESWETVYTASQSPSWPYILSVAIDPSNTDILYAGDGISTIVKSVDGGETWAVMSSLGNNAYPYDILVDPLDANIVYATTGNGRFVRSMDGGSTWTQHPTGLETQYLGFIRAYVLDGEVILYTADSRNTSGTYRMYRSLDRGETWASLFSSFFYSRAGAVLQKEESLWFPSYQEKVVYSSQDNGSTWSTMDMSGLPVVDAVWSISDDNNSGPGPEERERILLGTYNDSLYAYENAVPVFSFVSNMGGETNFEVSGGDVFAYDVTLQNLGWADGTEVVLSLDLPEGIGLTATPLLLNGSESTSFSVSGSEVDVNIGTLLSNSEIEIRLLLEVSPTASISGTQTISSRVYSDEDEEGTAFSDIFLDVLNVDSLAPSLSLDTPTTPTGDSTPTITGTATDASGTVSSVEYQLDSTLGSWSACTADDDTFDSASETFSCTTDELEEGIYTIYVRATDSNGNTTPEGEESEVSVTIDTTPPTLTLTPFPDNKTSDRTPSLTGTVTDTLSSVGSVSFRSTTNGTYSGSFTPCTADDGTFDELSESFSCDITDEQNLSAQISVQIKATDSLLNETIEAGYSSVSFSIVHPPNTSGGSRTSTRNAVTGKKDGGGTGGINNPLIPSYWKKTKKSDTNKQSSSSSSTTSSSSSSSSIPSSSPSPRTKNKTIAAWAKFSKKNPKELYLVIIKNGDDYTKDSTLSVEGYEPIVLKKRINEDGTDMLFGLFRLPITLMGEEMEVVVRK
jgi:photosystem II stability/assembly factor-like uncharacterized protein